MNTPGERRFFALLENVEGLVLLLDAEGRVLFAGGALPGLEEPAGRTLLELVHDDDRARILDQRGLEQGARAHLEVRFRSREGAYALHDSVIVNRLEDPHVQALVMTTVRPSIQLQHAQRLEGLGVLATGVSHELNNLLTGILGNASLALTDIEPTAPAYATVSAVERSSQRAAALVRQLRAYAGRKRSPVKAIDLSETITGISQLLRAVVPPRIEIRFELESALPPVPADPGQVQQIVLNLVTNASESLAGAPGVIAIATGLVHASREELGSSVGIPKGSLSGPTGPPGIATEGPPPGSYVALVVKDTGPGMDEETARRVFEPHFTTKLGARGLGLPAVLGIVRAHHGALFLETALNSGTTVRVLFPLR